MGGGHRWTRCCVQRRAGNDDRECPKTPRPPIHRLPISRRCRPAPRQHASASITLLDSTHAPHCRQWIRRGWLAAVSILILGSVCGPLIGLARADGDPASDVLLLQPLYLPQDAGVPGPQQAQLGSLLSAGRRSGYELRVALIAGPVDLGSVTDLWRQPQNYARFLGQELSLNYNRPLLVVMPNGYGLYRSGGTLAAEQSALSTLPPPGHNLGSGALNAIVRLAAASGHNLPAPTATAPISRGSTHTLAWIVFASGAVIIILAWIASLRARPLRPVRRRPSSTEDPHRRTSST